MTPLREAAQQALEALMDAQRHNYALKHKETDDLITALKAALAHEQSRAWYTIDEINAKFDPPKRQPPTDEEQEQEQAEPVQEYASIPGTNVRVPIRRKGHT